MPEGMVDLHLPVSDHQWCHTLLLSEGVPPEGLGGQLNPAQVIDIYGYAPMQPREQNRIRYGPDLDTRGLPRPRFRIERSTADEAGANAALNQVRLCADAIGMPIGNAPPRLLPPGTAQHLLGTSRIGGVVDDYGRVLGLERVSIAGTGLIPTASATNPTLTAVAFALALADVL
jgi:choline dehydrogenase-like flavoprotein